MQRKYFNESRGLADARRLCAAEYAAVTELPALQRKSYALAAACALLKYVEHVNNVVYAPRSLKVEFQASADSVAIDAETVKNVELLHPLLNIRSATGGKSNNSLFGLLNHCYTPGGVRHLRASLYQPPVKQGVIEEKLDSVEESYIRSLLFNNCAYDRV